MEEYDNVELVESQEVNNDGVYITSNYTTGTGTGTHQASEGMMNMNTDREHISRGFTPGIIPAALGQRPTLQQANNRHLQSYYHTHDEMDAEIDQYISSDQTNAKTFSRIFVEKFLLDVSFKLQLFLFIYIIFTTCTCSLYTCIIYYYITRTLYEYRSTGTYLT